MSHKNAVHGVLWSAVERFLVQGIQFILSIILARILLPSEYGLIAMLTVFLAVAQTFIDSGFHHALIQKQDRSQTDYSTVFYFNIIISVLIYFILYFCAPAIAQFYDQPQLILLTRWLSLSIIISAFSIVQRARLTINIDFERQAKAALISVIISGILGILLAYRGYGVWALVVQSLANNFLNTIFLWLFNKWWPSFCFSFESFRILFSYGSKLLIGALLQTVYFNLYTLVIGRKFAPANVGYYNRASTLSIFPSQTLTNIFTRATFPLLCQRQNDRELFRESTIKFLRYTCFFVFPLMGGLAVLGEPIINLLLGEKWLPAVPLFQILCSSYMIYPVMLMNWQALNALGRSDMTLKAEVFKKIAAFSILFASLPFNLTIICIGLGIYNVIDCFIITFYTNRAFGLSLKQELRVLCPIFILTFSTMIIMYLISSLFYLDIYKILFASFGGISLYLTGSILFKFPEINYVLNKIKKRR